MIARKILDRVDEPLDASEEPYGNLLLHPPPLQIKTSSITNMKRALRVGNTQVAHDSLIHFNPPSGSYQLHTPTNKRHFSRYINQRTVRVLHVAHNFPF
jgi:hypothetical protein